MRKVEKPAAMTVLATAEYLSISRTSIYRLLKTGDLKHAKIGGRTLIRRSDADALLERAVSSDAAGNIFA